MVDAATFRRTTGFECWWHCATDGTYSTPTSAPCASTRYHAINPNTQSPHASTEPPQYDAMTLTRAALELNKTAPERQVCLLAKGGQLGPRELYLAAYDLLETV